MTTVLTIILIWFLVSIPVSLLVGWALSRTKRDVPLGSRPSMPQGVVRVDFNSSQESEQIRQVGS